MDSVVGEGSRDGSVEDEVVVGDSSEGEGECTEDIVGSGRNEGVLKLSLCEIDWLKDPGREAMNREEVDGEKVSNDDDDEDDVVDGNVPVDEGVNVGGSREVCEELIVEDCEVGRALVVANREVRLRSSGLGTSSLLKLRFAKRRGCGR